MKNYRFLGLVLAMILLVTLNGGARVTASVDAGVLAPANQVTQFGITWTFDQDYTVGQFANGDFWVTGPVTITAISPPSTSISGRVVNGSMINPSPRDGTTQGYDSAMYGQYGPHFDAALNVARPNGQDLSPANPLVVPAGSSLVSSISHAEAGNRPQLETAAVLTVLDAPAPAGSFRPPYSGSDKTIRFNTSQIDGSLLAQLVPVASTPDMADVERYFERPWIDHVPNWMADYHHPSENLPNYGRNISTRVGVGALMLHLDFSYAEKETLLVRYLQLGIDLYGVLQDGGEANWRPNGGHTSGRKWPVLFAGLILGDEDMKNVGPGDGSGAYMFGEDGQTFYVSQQDVDRVHDPDLRSCHLEEYEQSDIGLPEWGIVHIDHPEKDNKAWCAIYRTCCTANAWSGFVLAAHIMDVKEVWDHDPLFDYQDRYMATEEVGSWQRCYSGFTADMWDTYRADYGPVWPDEALELTGSPGSETAYLRWEVNTTLPTTTTWRIDYVSDTLPSLVLTAIDSLSATRAYTLTDLTNYEMYTVTLHAMSGSTAFLSDTVRVMPTDIFVYLPLVERED